jgi:hypothetical protein
VKLSSKTYRLPQRKPWRNQAKASRERASSRLVYTARRSGKYEMDSYDTMTNISSLEENMKNEALKLKQARSTKHEARNLFDLKTSLGHTEAG